MRKATDNVSDTSDKVSEAPDKAARETAGKVSETADKISEATDEASEAPDKVARETSENSATPDSVVELANGRYKVTERTDTGTLVYEVEKTPWQIVRDSRDITTNTDPGLVGLIPKNIREIDREGVNAINLLKNVQSGYLFKVKTYDESGNMTYRYYHSWTSVSGLKNTWIPKATNPKLDPNYNKSVVDYYANAQLDYGKVTAIGVHTEARGNVEPVPWTESEPTAPPEDDSDTSYDPVLAISGPIISSSDKHDININAGRWEDLPGEPIWRNESDSGLVYSIHVGTKPVTKEEVVETRRTRYVANPDLDVDERVVDEGADKIKVTTTTYTLNRNSGPRSEVEGVPSEASNVDYPNVPTVENGGVTGSDTVTYRDARDKVIEKRVPRTTVAVSDVNPSHVRKRDPRVVGNDGKEIDIPGKNGTEEVTTNYTVNPDTG